MSSIALSHSRLSDYEQCPLKFKLKYLDKEPNFQIDNANKSIHLVRGENVHKALENYVNKRKDGNPADSISSSNLQEVNKTAPLIEKYISMFGIDNVHPERQICINSSWMQETWFSKNAFYRAIMDLICIGPTTAFIGDYKTGKFTDYTPKSGYGQLELSSAIALSIFDVEKVNNAYLYVDHKQVVAKEYEQKDRIRLVEHFEAKHLQVNEEVNFDPCKNQYCKYCEATKAQCKYSSKF